MTGLARFATALAIIDAATLAAAFATTARRFTR